MTFAPYHFNGSAIIDCFGGELTVTQAKRRRDIHLDAVETGRAITPEAALFNADALTMAIAEAVAASNQSQQEGIAA